MSSESLYSLLETPVDHLVEQTSESLLRIKRSADEQFAVAKSAMAHIDLALELKYGRRAHQLRLAMGKDAGVVHFDDGDVQITADLPKRVEWHQAKLADIARRIAASGDDPAQFVEISYRVSETKFNAWPQSLRSAFVPARTVKLGKPKFTLGRVGEGQP
jgi:hypothetical protein